jgi:maltooligosyltrehalose trehalohydrolase
MSPVSRGINFDNSQCEPVQRIFDFSAHHFLAEMKGRTTALAEHTCRWLHLTAESDFNDARLLRSPERDGYSLDTLWSYNFHHPLSSSRATDR